MGEGVGGKYGLTTSIAVCSNRVKLFVFLRLVKIEQQREPWPAFYSGITDGGIPVRGLPAFFHAS